MMSNKLTFDSVLLIGFGGPTSGCCQRNNPCLGLGHESPEAYCFVSEILARRMKGSSQPDRNRVDQVVAHYTELGGFSPFNQLTSLQASALSSEIGLPVFTGMRNWKPFLSETLSEMIEKGHKKVLGIILSPFQCFTSWEEYQQDVDEALGKLSAPNNRTLDISINYMSGWSSDYGYISSVTEQIMASCEHWSENRLNSAHLIFTAHSIPEVAAKRSPYSKQFAKTSELVAGQLGKSFYLAYQSSPDTSPIPWTGPDISELIPKLDRSISTDIIVMPIGFVCDHVEVLYDLDQEAKDLAEDNGFHFKRVPTVGASDMFIQFLAQKSYSENEAYFVDAV
ncbi:ferrochelatase [Candidatus Poribacteria bacterium]|nr:ferrochelatase [Candidatus Poribacteria bacterium]